MGALTSSANHTSALRAVGEEGGGREEPSWRHSAVSVVELATPGKSFFRAHCATSGGLISEGAIRAMTAAIRAGSMAARRRVSCVRCIV